MVISTRLNACSKLNTLLTDEMFYPIYGHYKFNPGKHLRLSFSSRVLGQERSQQHKPAKTHKNLDIEKIKY